MRQILTKSYLPSKLVSPNSAPHCIRTVIPRDMNIKHQKDVQFISVTIQNFLP